MSSLSTALKTAGLEKIIIQLEELGVETSDDLKLLDNDTIQALKINFIQKKKLSALVERIQSSIGMGDDMDCSDNVPNTRKRIKQENSEKQQEAEPPKRIKCTNMPVAESSRQVTSHDHCNIKSIQSKCKVVRRTSTLTIYFPKMKRVYVNKNNNFQKKVFGTPNHQYPERVVLIVGATGSGKTTLINGIINYLFSVKYSDPFRYKLMLDPQDGSGKQSESQTNYITAYTLYHQDCFPLPFNLTIIDTPGFGDTKGIKRDLIITEQIKNFFSTPGNEGIDHIDAVGFVALSSLARLTPTQQYIFDSILSLFGRDIEENIFLLLTFADGKKPQALAAIEQFNIPCKCWFKFNNSVLFSEIDPASSDNDNIDEMFWKMGTKSFRDFLSKLSTVTPKSLLMTKSVLDMRTKIQLTIQNLQEEISIGLTKLERLKEEVDIVLTHKSTIEQNENFTYTVTEESMKHVNIPPRTYITNCVKCNRTCHYPCAYSNDCDKVNCAAMKRGYCTVCPYKCPWSDHVNNDFRIITVFELVTKDSMDLKAKYQHAQGEFTSAEAIVNAIVFEIQARQLKIVGMASEVRKHLQELDKIALKPNPLSTLDYIDILIDSEKNNARPGWSERRNQLMEIRKEVVVMNSALTRGEDPFGEYKRKIEEERRTNQEGLWVTVGRYLENINFFKIKIF